MYNDDDNFNRFSEGDSKFNKSIADLMRLDMLQTAASKASLDRSWNGVQIWFDVLDRIRGEIYYVLPKQLQEELDAHRPKGLPPENQRRLLGNSVPDNIRRSVSDYHDILNKMIISKGLGYQIKDQDTVIILPGAK